MVGAKMFSFFAFCFIAGTFLSGIMEGEAAYAVTELTADIDDDGLIMLVVDTEDFLDADDIFVGSEEIRYTTKTDTQFDISTRGLGDTTAVAHTTGTRVKNESSNIVNNLLGYNVATQAATYGTMSAIVGLGWNLLKSVPKMIAWNYSYLEGQLVFVKYLILWPISVGFVFSLGMVFISAIQGIFRFGG